MRKKLQSVTVFVILCLGLMLVSSGCGNTDVTSTPLPSNEESQTSEATPQTYTVTFQSGEDTLEDVVVVVEEGQNATPPNWTLPFMELTGWSHDTSNVSQNMTVSAQWADKIMSGVEISQYAETRTVTIRAHNVYGNTSSGSGFFIDNEGTMITNYHVIKYADSLEVQLANAIYDVIEVINFSEKYDLAMLKVDIKDNDYFNITDEVQKGEQVYAVGSALGEWTDTMTSGIVSHASREVGVIECIQTDAAISHGNSGGPLINQHGKVVGVNSFSVTNGSSLNLAIKISMIDKMDEDCNYTITDYIEWWQTETSRSYRPTDIDDTDKCMRSLINTCQNYTDAKCILSLNSLYKSKVTDYSEGYNDQYWVFLYEYNQSDFDSYVAYLKDLGFVYDVDESGKYDLGDCSTFHSFSSDFVVDLIVTNERSEWKGKYLLIRTIY